MYSDAYDDAILLDSALNSVSNRDLEYLVREFDRSQQTSREWDHQDVNLRQEEEYVMAIDADEDGENIAPSRSDSEESSNFEPESDACSSDSGTDDESEGATTTLGRGGHEYDQIRCACCDNPRHLKLYGLQICPGCAAFVNRMVKQDFKVQRCIGSGNCRTTYSPTEKMRCSFCRLKSMLKINIQHPAWKNYKAKNGCKIAEDCAPQDAANLLDGQQNSVDNADGESVTSSHCGESSSDCNEDERAGAISSSNSGEQELSGPKCAACGRPNSRRLYCLNLCTSCKQFVLIMAKKEFKVDCILGKGACNVTYKPGCILGCQSCRLENMMKLSVLHLAWIKYKAERGITGETSDDLRRSGEKRHSEDNVDIRSVASSHRDCEESHNENAKVATESLIKSHEECEADDKIDRMDIDDD